MSDSKRQSASGHRAGVAAWYVTAWASLVLVAALVAIPTARAADSDPTTYPRREGPEILGKETPVGRLEYVPGRGLQVGKTKLTIGGFATVVGERLEGGRGSVALDGVDVFLFFDPVPYVHVFSALELTRLAEWDTDRPHAHSAPGVDIDRLYVDLGKTDVANLRFGRFLTPIGRWNQAPADPLVWTTSDPLIVEEVFDESVRGAMLWGTTFPRGAALSYGLYGTFLDSVHHDSDPAPAEHSAGARLEWTSLGGWSVGASYFASKHKEEGWHHLGGVDALWHPHERVELSMEAVFGEGSQGAGDEWGLYAQGVVEVVRTLYVVGRYEHFDPPERDQRTLNLFDVGLTWVPTYYLRLKADYRFADHRDELSAPGLRMSFSILF
jgi:hypothetical protein